MKDARLSQTTSKLLVWLRHVVDRKTVDILSNLTSQKYLINNFSRKLKLMVSQFADDTKPHAPIKNTQKML